MHLVTSLVDVVYVIIDNTLQWRDGWIQELWKVRDRDRRIQELERAVRDRDRRIQELLTGTAEV